MAFLAIMVAANTGWLTRTMAFYAVRLFGRRAFKGRDDGVCDPVDSSADPLRCSAHSGAANPARSQRDGTAGFTDRAFDSRTANMWRPLGGDVAEWRRGTTGSTRGADRENAYGAGCGEWRRWERVTCAECLARKEVEK